MVTCISITSIEDNIDKLWLAFDSLMLALPIAPASGVVRAGLKAGNGGKVAIKAVEKIEMHHEIPKYLGGAVKQKNSFGQITSQ